LGESSLNRNISRVKQFMAERNTVLTKEEISKSLGITESYLYSILDLMQAFDIVEKVKRGVYYYFLKLSIPAPWDLTLRPRTHTQIHHRIRQRQLVKELSRHRIIIMLPSTHNQQLHLREISALLVRRRIASVKDPRASHSLPRILITIPMPPWRETRHYRGVESPTF